MRSSALLVLVLLLSCGPGGPPAVTAGGPYGGVLGSGLRASPAARLALEAQVEEGALVTWTVLEGGGALEAAAGARVTFTATTEGTHRVRATARWPGGDATASAEAEIEVGPATWGYLGDAANGYAGSGLCACDLDGDGRDELVVGVPFADTAGASMAGRVDVLSFSRAGRGERIATLVSPVPQTGADFGWALACGDLNGDGRADLVVGEHLASVHGVLRAGKAHLFFAGDAGLFSGATLTLIAPNPREQSDLFGVALAVGDLNGDGLDDLAVSAMNYDVGGFLGAGAVFLFQGGASFSDQPWAMVRAGTPSRLASFGVGLAIGGGGTLVVGAPGSLEDRGELAVFSGGDPASWSTPSATLALEPAQIGDRLGSGVAVLGDPGGDGLGGIVASRMSRVGTGAAPAALAFWSGRAQWSGRLAPDHGLDTFDPSDQRGRDVVLSPGDLDGDGLGDLVLGAAYADVGEAVLAGRVHVLTGRAGDWPSGPPLTLEAPTPQVDDRFGMSLAAGDFDGDGRRDLAVAAPQHDKGELSQAGAVWVHF